MIHKNDVLEQTQTKNLFRVIHLDYAANDIWLFLLSDATAVPKCFALDDTESAIAKGYMRIFEGSDVPSIHTPSPAAIAFRDQAYEVIKPLIDSLDILEPNRRSELIKERANGVGCSPQTIYKHLRNWWRNGQTPNALLPMFHAKGSTGGQTRNRGRPARYQKRGIYQVTSTDLELFEKVINKHFLKSEHGTLSDAYQRLCEEYAYVDGEGRRHVKPDGEFPSEQQFRYFAKKILPEETVIRRKKGDAEFELNHRPKLGSISHELYTVGQCYEIDSTIADVLLVASHNRSVIIGKPTLYLVVCRKSWLIVGYYVGLEEPSWPAAMQAVKSIAEDKAALCQRFGIEFDPNDWPAHGILPKEIFADRGPEVIGGESTRLADGLEITVTNLPRRRADRKPRVECGFKLLQRSIASVTPGYVPPENAGKRQGQHYELDACLTLKEFTAIILREIIRFNRSPIKDYIWSPEFLLEDIQPTPINIWNTEVRRRAGALPRIREEQIRFALLPRIDATVTKDGIAIGSCYYSCPEAIRRGWMVIAGQRGEFKVRASYDRRLVDTVYVHDDKDPTKFFVATLLDKCSHYRGLSFQEVAAIDFFRARLQQKGKHIKRQNLLESHEVQDPIAREAHKQMKLEATGKKRSSRKKDIVQDRINERRAQRQEDARLPGPTPAGQTTAEVISLPQKGRAEKGSDLTEDVTNPMSEQDAKRRQKYQEMLDGK